MTGKRRKPPEQDGLFARAAPGSNPPSQVPSPSERSPDITPIRPREDLTPQPPDPFSARGADAASPRSRDVVPNVSTSADLLLPDYGPPAAPGAASSPTSVRSRRRLLVAGVIVLLVVVVAAWWFILRSPGGDDPTAGPSGQRTLLIHAASADGTALSSALLGVEASGREGAVILIPSRLMVDVPRVGTAPFGEIASTPEENASADALSDLLGVRIDATWVLSPAALAALVERVGGIQADVDVEVSTKGKNGEALTLQAGPQELNGSQAAAYATYSAEEEPEQARLARFNEVLSQVLRRLPDKRSELAVALAALDESRSSVPLVQLERTLLALHKASVRQRLLADVLPVDQTVTAGEPAAYELDVARAKDLLQLRFSSALVGGGPKEVVRVLVENGVGTPALSEAARARLVKARFGFLDGGQAPKLGVRKTRILIRDNSPQSIALGKQVAAALGVGAQPTESLDRERAGADVIVILGADFKP